MKILDIPRSGSYAGITSSRNRGGQYVRNRRAPVQPIGSGRRAFIRAAFGNASIGWATIGSEAQEAWNSFAEGHPVTNSLGASIVLTGHQMYIAVATQRVNAGLASSVNPPSTTGVQTLVSVAVVADSSGLLTVAVDSSSAGGKNLIAFSPPLSAGRSFPPRFWQAATEAGVTTPVATDRGPLFVAEFGTMVAGQKLFVKVTPVNDEGWTGTPSIVSAVIAEA